MSDYKPTIGVEIHTQLATDTKMFCSCDNDSIEAAPNTHICPVCLAYPGTLPVPNKRAVELAIRLGLGLNAEITRQTKFDRKNYFYPDSPKGYQITQFDQPIVGEGSVEIFVDGAFQKVRIERAHMEEDAGKLTHPAGADYSLVDLNRAGTPLVEIVSHPDMHSPQEVKRYLQEVYAIATSLGVTHGNMQHGNFKFDLNVSISNDPDVLGTRTELKNLNSFRNAERALTYEIKRQIAEVEKGNKITQETRGWDDAKGVTFSQRSKEEAHDYRYFPEPDIPPLVITDAMIATEQLVVDATALPIDVRRGLVELGLTPDEQDIFVGQAQTSAIFQAARSDLGEDQAKAIVNWLIGPYQEWLESTEEGTESKLTGAHLAELIKLVADGTISSKMAKDIFTDVIAGESPSSIIKRSGATQISDVDTIVGIIKAAMVQNPQGVADYKAGNAKALGYFVGQVMKETQGQANPQVVNQELRALLDSA
jgi:aspartyl-tRNA(Asn)/glutamyl-tRNA(Gln) amidotransferase subunit B